ncbi:MAG: cysteine synthase A [Deltaproteobacteria bacterium]|nr:cysteine synthase A [Deltaproteobacteria bacterium]MBK8240974.1 cysteine synthase A [Deltaproteobacteria bacterium]MBK8714015.1 cysteine synthase A [Deltaproteobacteria bacterium]MBP7291188.1 cysteine synthase A [Nannocystaceae bacterium]
MTDHGDNPHAARKAGRRIAASILDLVGHTPLVRLQRLPAAGAAEVVAKLEGFNPGGSVKDRPALFMIEAAEAAGLLDANTVVIEPTSGNTGIGLAMVCAARGYRCILVMPDSMSLERNYLLKRLGAEVVLTPAKHHMTGAVAKAEELARKHARAFMPRQFENDGNPEAHSRSTALELLEATEGHIDALVVGVGTGGTITGVGRVLRQQLPSLRIVAVEPASSPVLQGGRATPHRIQGIGAGFVPMVLERGLIDEVRSVSDEDAFMRTGELAAREGILAGPSSGAAVHVALAVASELGAGKRVVTVFPDTADRYMSTASYFEL